MSTSLSDRELFEQHVGLAYHVSRKSLTREDGTRPSDDDVQDLVGESFALLPKVRAKFPELEPHKWVAYAVRRANWARRSRAHKARLKGGWNKTPHVALVGGVEELEHLADIPRFSCWGDEFLQSLPEDDKAVATAIAITDNQEDARRIYGALRGAHCNEYAWDAHVRSLRRALEDALPEYAQARQMGDADFADAVPTAPRPMGRPAPEPIRSIPMQYEHETALHNLLHNPKSVEQFVCKLAGWKFTG